MKRFPTVYELANASEDEVNAHWAGLGFYRRARMLRSGAKYVVDELDGVVPDTVEDLMKIDGIGRYTASAVASIAFDICVPVVDGNVCRVLSRLKGIANNIKAPVFKDRLGWNLAEQIVSAGGGKYAGEVNQALMELGATYCAPSGTGIDSRDPLRKFYMSTRIGKEVAEIMDGMGMDDFVSKAGAMRGKEQCALCDPGGVSNVLNHIREDLIIKSKDKTPSQHAAIVGHGNLPTAPIKKAKREEILAVVALSYDAEGSIEKRWLMTRRPKQGLLAGQWEFPNTCVWSSTDGNDKKSKKKKSNKNIAVELPSITVKKKQAAVNELTGKFSASSIDGQWLDKSITHIFSHVRHTMYIQHDKSLTIEDPRSRASAFTKDNTEYRWMAESDMKNVGITSGVKKVLAAVKEACTKQQQTSARKAAKRMKRES